MKNIHNIDEVYEELQNEDVQLKNKYNYTHPIKTKNKSKIMSLGRIWFNLLLPDDYKLINEQINKKKISQIIDDVYKIYDIDIAVTYLNNLNDHAFKMASVNPISFTIDEVIVPQEIREKKKNKLKPKIQPEEFTNVLEELANEHLNILGDNSGIKQIIDSGAKGKNTDFGVLMLAKGPVLDIEGNISKPILTGQSDGYNGKEYYTLAGESRRALYIRGIGTAEPGTLARDTTYANANTTISKKDCKTKKYLEITVTKSIFTTIQGRYYMDEKTNELIVITKDNKLIGEKIKLRSPLYCRSKNGICEICYGQLTTKLGTKHIGLLAGEVINEAGIEGFSMSVRHKSLQLQLSPVDFTKDLIQI